MIKYLYDKFAKLLEKPIDWAVNNFKLIIGSCMITTSILLIFVTIRWLKEDTYSKQILFSTNFSEYLFLIIILIMGLFIGIKWINEYFKEKINKLEKRQAEGLIVKVDK